METKKFNVGELVTFGDNNLGVITRASEYGIYMVRYVDLNDLTKVSKAHIDNPDYLKPAGMEDAPVFAWALKRNNTSIDDLLKEDAPKEEVKPATNVVKPTYITGKVEVGEVVSFPAYFGGVDEVGIVVKCDGYYTTVRYIDRDGKLDASVSQVGERFLKVATDDQKKYFFDKANNSEYSFTDIFTLENKKVNLKK
jgi:hypothetical protein